jgi:hypothetical protein
MIWVFMWRALTISFRHIKSYTARAGITSAANVYETYEKHMDVNMGAATFFECVKPAKFTFPL